MIITVNLNQRSLLRLLAWVNSSAPIFLDRISGRVCVEDHGRASPKDVRAACSAGGPSDPVREGEVPDREGDPCTSYIVIHITCILYGFQR